MEKNRLHISDFKAGGKAYQISKGVPVAVEIEKVGRKFVYIKGGWYGFFLRDEDDDHLVENKDWGTREALYLTEQEAKDSADRTIICDEIRKLSNETRENKLSIDQLRRISAIIHE